MRRIKAFPGQEVNGYLTIYDCRNIETLIGDIRPERQARAARQRPMTDISSPAAKIAETRYVITAAALSIAVLTVFWMIGRTDRVIYLGPDHGQVPMNNQVPLKTEPAGNYFIARNAAYAAMKSGCLYDLNYAPEFGRNRERHPPRGRTKYVRSATLVNCP